MADKPKIIDAEFRVIRPGKDYPGRKELPWWFTAVMPLLVGLTGLSEVLLKLVEPR